MSRRLGQGLATAAVLIGVITILARVVGFAKQLVLARTVGMDCLATAYFTANQVPNMVFEVVVGGALAGMVVPVLAGAAARGTGGQREGPAGADAAEARARAGWITSALLTWVLVVLVPLSVLTAVAAGPVIGLLAGEVGGCETGDLTAVATRMLVVFAPQIPLYGLAVVLYGVLQAHRRFAGPAVAPLVSSLVVIVAYLAFPPLSGGVTEPLSAVPRPAELALSVGTTLGVVALVVTVIGPASRLRLPLRPTLRFPEGVAVRVRRLALAGLGALVAQQAAMALVVWLANHEVGAGGIAGYNYAWAVYQVPYAVLAVPIATSAFPALSASAERADHGAFAALSARTTRAVVLVSGLAAGALAAVAVPVAVVFAEGMAGGVRADELARTIALFAPGLVGYGLVAHLSRVLYAQGRGRAASGGTIFGWLVVMVAQTILVITLPAPWKLGGLALGGTVGMTAAGAVLLWLVARSNGARTLAGVARALAAAVLGGGAGFLAGYRLSALLDARGPVAGAGVAALAGLAAVAAGLAVAALADRRSLAALLSRARRGRPGPGGAPGTGDGEGGDGDDGGGGSGHDRGGAVAGNEDPDAGEGIPGGRDAPGGEDVRDGEDSGRGAGGGARVRERTDTDA
ncbi:lipid II flippase MurJ [Sphaerisporangium sp. TRM90804]|uniref:murein biosynthesis integral membrane protein MurJ n=1 Tax=Sphaerisporangium sp. TRM90804 TaxID=3031113 RepID=UPI0024482D14|nr:lipid II flippase MurJ [Sphaerisporangium sp. TRM90804]MDH2430293.1 lipid II flippase MurJ [Sphaerisporangium sp. TRM90804]